jgi:hypothetical protein
VRRRSRPLEQLALSLDSAPSRWTFSRLVLRSPNRDRIRDRIEFVRAFFPELDGVTIRVGLAQKRGVLGWGSLDPERPGIWVRPRRLDHFTIAHELTHLLQARGLVPRGERACDLWALARSPLLVDAPPGYLRLPVELRRKRWLEPHDAEPRIDSTHFDGDNSDAHSDIEEGSARALETLPEPGQKGVDLSSDGMDHGASGPSLRLEDLRVGMGPARTQLSASCGVDHRSALQVRTPQPGENIFRLRIPKELVKSRCRQVPVPLTPREAKRDQHVEQRGREIFADAGFLRRLCRGAGRIEGANQADLDRRDQSGKGPG